MVGVEELLSVNKVTVPVEVMNELVANSVAMIGEEVPCHVYFHKKYDFGSTTSRIKSNATIRIGEVHVRSRRGDTVRFDEVIPLSQLKVEESQ